MENEINIRVKTLDGRELQVKSSRSQSVGEFKDAVHGLTEIRPQNQRIIYQGRMLTDDLTLGTAGLENNSVVHLVERAPPTQNVPRAESGPQNTESAPVEAAQENDQRRNSRNRIRSQLERHTSQFMQSVSQVVAQDIIMEDGPADSEMQSFARQLLNIANGLELLPDYLRILADQVRNDPPNPTQQLQDNLHHLTTITQRLGALSNTLSNIQVPIQSPPPRRLELNRRLPSSLRDLSLGQVGSGGLVIPVVHGANGNIETGPITQLGGNIIGNAIESAIGGIHSNLAGLLNPEGNRGDIPEEEGPRDRETNSSGNAREPSLTARVMTMISRPSDIDGNPIDPGIDRVEGINANITINANVSPNVTIRIIPESLQSVSNLPHSAHQNVTPNQPTQNSTPQPTQGESRDPSSRDPPSRDPPEFVESTPEEISRRVPALAPEIVQQIRDSVANLNDGRPVVIECENQNTNSEIGRVIGEAVTQTFQSLSDQITDQVLNDPATSTQNNNSRSTATTTTETSTTTTQTTTRDNNGQTHSTHSQTQSRRENGAPVSERTFSFGREEMSASFLEYLGAPESSGNPIIGMVRNILTDVRLGDIVQIMDVENAPRSIAELSRKMMTFAGMIETGMKTILRLFFDGLESRNNADLIQSNLSLLRELLSRLGPSIENAIDLGRLIKEISLKWIKLNSSILGNGVSDLISRLKRTLVLNEHPRSIIETIFCNAIVSAHSIDITKYIVKEEIPTSSKADELEEDDIDEDVEEEEDPADELVEDPIDEVIENERETKKETPTQNKTESETEETQRRHQRVIEVTERDVPVEWRRVLMLDSQNLERLEDFELSEAYSRAIPTSSKQI